LVFDSADASFKQAVKVFNELKANDPKIREGFVYTNEMLENFSKVAICNNLLISKLRKLESPINLVYSLKKYKCNVPVLEFK